MAEFTTIRINSETKEALDLIKLPSESYSSLAIRLLEENKRLEETIEFLKEDRTKLYELALGTSNSVALVNNIHKATYFITLVINDVSSSNEEKLQQLEIYLTEMLENNPEDVKATVENLIDMLQLEEVNVPEVLIDFESYLQENY